MNIMYMYMYVYHMNKTVFNTNKLFPISTSYNVHADPLKIAIILLFHTLEAVIGTY